MALGAAIGAITFTGSIIAFGKLQGFITGKPLTFVGQHKLNAGIRDINVPPYLCILWHAIDIHVGGVGRRCVGAWCITHHANWWRGHARYRFHVEFIFWLGGRRYRFHT